MEAAFGHIAQRNPAAAFKLALKLFDGPLDLTWQHASATCDFLSDMMAMRCERAQLGYNDARHSIAYLVNEMLENSIKFKSAGDVGIYCSLDRNRFEISISNAITFAAAEKFQKNLVDIVDRDPGELLIERIEMNAADENSSASGLGILTLMNDYGAKLGWKFDTIPQGSHISLSTFAAIEII